MKGENSMDVSSRFAFQPIICRLLSQPMQLVYNLMFRFISLELCVNGDMLSLVKKTRKSILDKAF